MTERNDGGPAFPLHPGVLPEWTASAGMSLRDWFAGQVLSGLMANPNIHGIIKQSAVDDEEAGQTVSRLCNDYATYMLEARK